MNTTIIIIDVFFTWRESLIVNRKSLVYSFLGNKHII